MAEVEEDILEEGAAIIWVLERDQTFQEGTAELCRETMNRLGSDKGWCVGDYETVPTPGTFDESPFSERRGFDILVERESMKVVFSTSHGTPDGNENIDGEELLEVIRGL